MSNLVDLRTLFGKRTAVIGQEQLGTIPLPDQTDTYTPIGHKELLDMVTVKLSENGISIVQEKLAVWRGGQRFFGVLQVQHERISSPDMALMVGIRNSLDKSLPACIGAGASVFICSNGVFAASEVTLSRKHTKFLFSDLNERIGMAVMSLEGLWHSHLSRVKSYKDFDLGNLQAHDLVIQAYRNGVIDKTQIADVVNEWYAPRYQERKERNLWSLHNAFTEALKGRADLINARSVALHELLDLACGFVPAPAK